ncbi:MAG: NAD(P)/FAD-dependent oxidoreductase [Bacteroidota bacterium]
MQDVIIIGGGLSGLINAILLAKNGLRVTLIEKKKYPLHRVCGEYISNEVRPFLEKHELFPNSFQIANITEFLLTSTSGKAASLPLDLGAFGISRYELDRYWYKKALDLGVQFQLNTMVSEIDFKNDFFQIKTRKGEELEAKIVIGSFGKRSILDRNMNRASFHKKSPYIGVKYHIETDFSKHTVALHNFKDGYCGLNKVEDNRYNLCYLSHRKNLREHGSIKTMETEVLYQNPHLKHVFQNSNFLFEQPKVINEISFAKKRAVENHVLMSGDAAGMITPLCGNGMAMAIHSAKILSETILAHWNAGNFERNAIERVYTQQWNQLFATRLWAGRQIQALFGGTLISEVAVGILKNVKPLARFLMKQTHGNPFE